MPVETAEDRATFVDPDDFGISLTYRRKDIPADTTINGIFDNEFALADIGDAAVSTTTPAVIVQTDDLPNGGRQNDYIIITVAALTAAELPETHAGSYRINIVMPDGTGMTVLGLEKQRDVP